jgi:phospholipase C
MKASTRILFSLFFLGAALAPAQTYQPPPAFRHVVIVVQENRTPDNLFGAGAGVHGTCGSEDPFETGVDIDNGGPIKGHDGDILPGLWNPHWHEPPPRSHRLGRSV